MVNAPTLSTFMVSAGTIPVSGIIIKPGSETYALDSGADAFASGEIVIPEAQKIPFLSDPRLSQPPADSRFIPLDDIPKDAKITLSPEGSSTPVVDMMSSRQRLGHLFESARKARTENDLASAYRDYRKALRLLGKSEKGEAPQHMYIPSGYSLYREALFETSVLSPPERAPGNLARLTNFLDSPPLGENTPALDTAKAKILTAFNLMHHTGSTFDKQAFLFQVAIDNLSCLIAGVRNEPQSKARDRALRAGQIILDGAAKQTPLTPRTKRKALKELRKGLVAIDHDHWDEFEKSREDAAKGIVAEENKSVITNYLSEVNTVIELMYQAESAAAPQKTLYRRALEMVEGARESIVPTPIADLKDADDAKRKVEAQKADLELYSRLFAVELRARQMVLASGRRDKKSMKELAEDISLRLKDITEEYSVDPNKKQTSKYESELSVEGRNGLIASYETDVSILMGRLGLWSEAISQARAAISGPYEETSAAAKLLKSDAFKPFVKGHGIISDVEIRKRAKKGSFRKRFTASLADAHSSGALDSLFFGLTGAAAGVALDYGISHLMGTEPNTLVSGTAGAILASAGRRFTNAWRSEDVLLSLMTGKYERSFGQSVGDAGKLLVHGAMDAIPWILPSYLAGGGYSEGYDLVEKTITKSGGAAVDWVGSGITSLFNPETYVNILNNAPAIEGAQDLLHTALQAYAYTSLSLAGANLIWRDAHAWTKKWGAFFAPGLVYMLASQAFPNGFAVPPGADAAAYLDQMKVGLTNLSGFLHSAMTGGAALLFASTFLPSSSKAQSEHLRRMSAAFLPAAAILSADIAYSLAPDKEPYAWRIVRSGILALEGYIMMNALGLVKWNYRPRRSMWENARSFVEANVMANPTLPLVMLTTNAVTAPLGGYIQRNKDVIHPLLIAMQGVAITACILPITLGVSGVLKRKIPIFERAAEGWRDAQNAESNAAAKIAMGIYAGGMGFFSGFNTPYTWNRILRSGTWDVIPAGLRAWGGGGFAEAHLGSSGWDSIGGQSMMSGTNIMSGNVISTRMWPELSGTRWERESIVDAMKNATERLEKIDRKENTGRLSPSNAEYARMEVRRTMIDFFLKAGRVIDPFHILRPHASLADRMIPFYAVVMAKNPPTFPQKTNVHFFANLFSMLYANREKTPKGKEKETFSNGDLAVLLRFAKTAASDPSTYDIVLPLIQTLALARQSKDANFRYEINKFFDDNPHIPIMLGVNLDGNTYSPLEEKYMRVARRSVRWKVRSRHERMSEYINGHRRQGLADLNLDGIFMTDVETSDMKLARPEPKAPEEKTEKADKEVGVVETLPAVGQGDDNGNKPAE